MIASATSLAQSRTGSGPGGRVMPSGSQNLENMNLTDHERYMVDHHYDHNYHNEQLEEICADFIENDRGTGIGRGGSDYLQAACEGREHQATREVMIRSLSQMYSLVMGLGILGSDIQLRQPGRGEEEAAEVAGEAAEEAAEEATSEVASEASEERESRPDYCRYIAMATEVGAMAFQSLGQQNIVDIASTQETQQKGQLYQVAMAHDRRADAAMIQSIGWGATTACYIAQFLVPPGAAGNLSNIARLAASGIFATFWINEVVVQKNRANTIRKIADALPGKGACNPVTDRLCFCSRPENRYNTDYCVPEDFMARALEGPGVPSSCINDQLQEDPHCQCLNNDSCFDTVMEYRFDGLNFAMGPNSPAGQINALTRGRAPVGPGFDEGQIRQGMQAIRNRADRIIDENLSNLRPRREMSDNENQMAEEFHSLGMPPRLAAAFAQVPFDEKGLERAQALFSGSANTPSSAISQGRSSDQLGMSGGHGMDNSRRSSSSGSSSNPFAQFMQQDSGGGNEQDRVLEFRGRAAASQSAQISNRPEHSVFDIISRRYRTSAYRRLDID